MKSRAPIAVGLLLLILAPLIGGVIRGLPREFLELPPVTQYVDHAPLSRPVMILFSVLAALALALLLRPSRFGFTALHRSAATTAATSYPPWFWGGLVLNLVAWAISWAPVPALRPLRDHVFFPMWLGYILVADGLVHRRTGTSLLARSPRAFAALFPASAAAWWYFEYLNRFVQNWWYEDIGRFGALHYVIAATFSFSTVLPAIFETRDALLSTGWFQRAYREGLRWRAPGRPLLFALTASGAAGLALLALWPNAMFFLTWLAPLSLLAGSLALGGIETPFSDLKRGDYTRLFALATAALVCGFFWEMWNFWSLPKWHYTVPFVNAARVFEMPLVGYTGYLPFGPICWCLWQAIEALGRKRGPP